MPSKGSCGSKFSELVPDHVLRDEQLDELPSVVDKKIVADEIRDNGAVAGPRLERLAMTGRLLSLYPNEQPVIDKRSLFHRPTHAK